MKTNSANGTAIPTALRPATLGDIPERVRQIAMLRGLGYSYRQIAGPLHVTPQAVSLMLMRHRRSLKSLRDAMELNSLSARAVNVLGRHGIRTREQARQADLLERLARERNCGRKTMDEIARWMEEDGESAVVQNGQEVAVATMGGV
jgi:predicted transcriptional regulator